MRIAKTLIRPAVSLIAVILLAGESSLISQRLQPVISWTGPHSQVAVQRCVRIQDSPSWEQTWLNHLGKTANEAFNDSDTQIQIDFADHEVVGIFQGSGWNSRGIRILDIKKIGNEIRIRYENISYQTSGIDGGGEKVSAYAFLVFPKSKLDYRIEENTQGLKDHPSKWTERALLTAAH